MRYSTQFKQYLSITRIITGLIVAPCCGLLVYFIALSLQSPISFDAFSSTLMSSLISFLSIISNLGPYFLVPALILGTIVMLLLMKYYSCNIEICVIGSVMNAFLVAILFLILYLISGTVFMPALAGSVLLLSLIAIPAILAGILFWFIAVFKNAYLITLLKLT